MFQLFIHWVRHITEYNTVCQCGKWNSTNTFISHTNIKQTLLFVSMLCRNVHCYKRTFNFFAHKKYSKPKLICYIKMAVNSSWNVHNETMHNKIFMITSTNIQAHRHTINVNIWRTSLANNTYNTVSCS